MSTSSLHNPRSVWFLGAPVSKVIAISTGVIYIAAETKKWHEAMVFDTTKIFDHAQFYRIFVCNLTFGSMGELVFGLAALCPLLRRFEREMGSRKFGTFLLHATLLSTLLELLFFNIFFDTERYSGPYPQLGAVLYLYHKYTPRLHPKFYGVLGCDFSEKSLTYGLCGQVFLSGGWSTLLPTFFGSLSASLCANWSLELPEFVYAAAGVAGRAFADEAPAVMMARSVQRGWSARSRPRGGSGRQGTAAVPTAQPPLPPLPPSEEAIEQLTSMGFEREAVIRALRQSDNNVEAAANRLLMG